MNFKVLLLLAASTLTTAAADAADGGTMYKCPGNQYNNTFSAKEAKEKGCQTLEGTPITIIQSGRPRAPAQSAPPTTSGPTSTRVDPADQRARDNDSRRILEAELKREEDRLKSMKTDFKDGQPERQGDEKNYQKYLDRVSEMKDAIVRKEGDINALRRELSKQAR